MMEYQGNKYTFGGVKPGRTDHYDNDYGWKVERMFDKYLRAFSQKGKIIGPE